VGARKLLEKDPKRYRFREVRKRADSLGLKVSSVRAAKEVDVTAVVERFLEAESAR
jgi:hypothetical protein